MLERLKSFFTHTGPATGKVSVADEKTLAAAALMVEAAMMDETFGAQERNAITRILEQRFGVSEAEAAAVIAEAERAQADANHLLRFTRSVKDTFSPEDRIEVIEMLWEVAYADGRLHDYESNLLRRVCGLIYVSDRDSGAARKRVLARLGLSS